MHCTKSYFENEKKLYKSNFLTKFYYSSLNSIVTEKQIFNFFSKCAFLIFKSFISILKKENSRPFDIISQQGKSINHKYVFVNK